MSGAELFRSRKYWPMLQYSQVENARKAMRVFWQIINYGLAL